MTGKRRDDGTPEHELAPGDYAKVKNQADFPGWWTVKMPPAKATGKSYWGHLSPKVHSVTEHEDGTITVSPSIHQQNQSGETLWHGWLERGVWREC